MSSWNCYSLCVNEPQELGWSDAPDKLTKWIVRLIMRIDHEAIFFLEEDGSSYGEQEGEWDFDRIMTKVSKHWPNLMFVVDAESTSWDGEELHFYQNGWSYQESVTKNYPRFDPAKLKEAT